MSLPPHSEGDASRLLIAIAELVRLQQQLLAQAERARQALEPPHYVWTVDNSERSGYFVPVGGPRLSDSERKELLTQLRTDVAALQRLSVRIGQLRALATELEERKDPEQQ